MGDSVTPDKPDRPEIESNESMSPEESLEALKQHYAQLIANNRHIKEELKQRKQKEKELKNKLDHLNRRNTALKSGSYYIATVKDVIEDGRNAPAAIVRQHGNNQEIMTEIPEDFDGELEAGDRVTIEDSYRMQEKIVEETDSRAQAMEVERSPQVTYADIGGISDELMEVREALEQPLNNPERFETVGIDPPKGFLLHGPPGTGKTLMAKAVANETNATFIKLAGSELVQKFIGEGARLVRSLFDLAEREAPSIIFIDEIDAIASKRTDSKTSGDAEVQRTLMQLLAKMDGFEDRGDVRIMAATNRFDMLDEAILRPGRFDRLIEVGLPDEDGRAEIFQIHTRDMNLSDNVDFSELAARTDNFSGADIENVTTEAGMFSIREDRVEVTQRDFIRAIDRIREDDDLSINEGQKRYVY